MKGKLVSISIDETYSNLYACIKTHDSQIKPGDYYLYRYHEEKKYCLTIRSGEVFPTIDKLKVILTTNLRLQLPLIPVQITEEYGKLGGGEMDIDIEINNDKPIITIGAEYQEESTLGLVINAIKTISKCVVKSQDKLVEYYHFTKFKDVFKEAFLGSTSSPTKSFDDWFDEKQNQLFNDICKDEKPSICKECVYEKARTVKNCNPENDRNCFDYKPIKPATDDYEKF
jgi:hypothetical protein